MLHFPVPLHPQYFVSRHFPSQHFLSRHCPSRHFPSWQFLTLPIPGTSYPLYFCIPVPSHPHCFASLLVLCVPSTLHPVTSHLRHFAFWCFLTLFAPQLFVLSAISELIAMKQPCFGILESEDIWSLFLNMDSGLWKPEIFYLKNSNYSSSKTINAKTGHGRRFSISWIHH